MTQKETLIEVRKLLSNCQKRVEKSKLFSSNENANKKASLRATVNLAIELVRNDHYKPKEGFGDPIKEILFEILDLNNNN